MAYTAAAVPPVHQMLLPPGSAAPVVRRKPRHRAARAQAAEARVSCCPAVVEEAGQSARVGHPDRGCIPDMAAVGHMVQKVVRWGCRWGRSPRVSKQSYPNCLGC